MSNKQSISHKLCPINSLSHTKYSQSHLWCHFRKLKKDQSSNVSFATFQWKETFELWALSFETLFKNVTSSGIGCMSNKSLSHFKYAISHKACTIKSRMKSFSESSGCRTRQICHTHGKVLCKSRFVVFCFSAKVTKCARAARWLKEAGCIGWKRMFI